MKDIKLNSIRQLDTFFKFVEEFGEVKISPATKQKLKKNLTVLKNIQFEESESHEVEKRDTR